MGWEIVVAVVPSPAERLSCPLEAQVLVIQNRLLLGCSHLFSLKAQVSHCSNTPQLLYPTPSVPKLFPNFSVIPSAPSILPFEVLLAGNPIVKVPCSPSWAMALSLTSSVSHPQFLPQFCLFKHQCCCSFSLHCGMIFHCLPAD